MLFSKSPGVEEFWKNREEEIGSPILATALGRVIREEEAFQLWGLFYTTSKTLYFQTFESNNWYSLLVSREKRTKKSRDEIWEIPFESLLRFELRPKKKGFLGFFAPPPLVHLSWKDETGKEKICLIEMERGAEALIRSALASENRS
ncbi:MAG: hypothetical protein B0D92_08115 [Spirochaeta sp. LUC14_002_19_P3]|nr:MAG: hypothetical protein B0D92_08115 [Spirochaeta sp. LUC14_002_19_P3]